MGENLLDSLNPRKAKGNIRLKETFQQNLYTINPNSDKLLFDLAGTYQQQQVKNNNNFLELENDLWEAIANVFAKDSDHNEVDIVILSDMFVFSSQLKEIFSLVCKEKFNLLKEKNLWTFTIPYDDQARLISMIEIGNNQINQENWKSCSNVWFQLLLAIQNLDAKELTLKYGIVPKLAELLKMAPSSEIINVFSWLSLKFTLRCSEEVIANILLEGQNEGQNNSLDKLLQLKKIQILSGKNLYSFELQKKFKDLNKYYL